MSRSGSRGVSCTARSSGRDGAGASAGIGGAGAAGGCAEALLGQVLVNGGGCSCRATVAGRTRRRRGLTSAARGVGARFLAPGARSPAGPGPARPACSASCRPPRPRFPGRPAVPARSGWRTVQPPMTQRARRGRRRQRLHLGRHGRRHHVLPGREVAAASRGPDAGDGECDKREAVRKHCQKLLGLALVRGKRCTVRRSRLPIVSPWETEAYQNGSDGTTVHSE